MAPDVDFQWLAGVDCIVEQVYRGGTRGTVADDPLSVLLPVGNQGGFRYKGSPTRGDVRLVVLYTSGRNTDWPDELDLSTGTFTYFGDNRDPGRELHDTQRRGNVILRDAFANAAGGPDERALVPPFLLFEKASSEGRDVRFRGLMVPGSPLVLADEQLVAIWRARHGQRFQNYRAMFSVLNASVITRAWIDDIIGGHHRVPAPSAWTRWVEGGAYDRLEARPTTKHRTRADQLPTSSDAVGLLNTLWSYFRDEPVRFERCAVELFRYAEPGLQEVNVTRPTRDGGRDALGYLAVGPATDPVRLGFALEAKCYRPGNSVGVREVSRLISRIKHREFGVMVTTSYVHEQAYREIREDGHPIIVFAGIDIVNALRGVGITTIPKLQAWLEQEFPAVEPLPFGEDAHSSPPAIM